MKLFLVGAFFLGTFAFQTQAADLQIEYVKELREEGSNPAALLSRLKSDLPSAVRGLKNQGYTVTSMRIYDRCEADWGLADLTSDDQFTCFAEISYIK